MTPNAPLTDVDYLCFTADHDEADAARRFAAKYGAPPEYIIEYCGKLWLGPIVNAGNNVVSCVKGIDKISKRV